MSEKEPLEVEFMEPEPEQALAVVQPDSLILSPVMDIAVAKKRLAEFQEFVRGYLVEGEDFGTIPGTPKATLYKPGADKLCELYGLADTYEIKGIVENYGAEPALFDYTFECSLRRGERLVATGWGSCNSYESKYKLREAHRLCPLCQKPAIIKGQEQYGGGWVCWKRRDGCGGKFQDGDERIESQPSGKVPNEDIATLKNTILKMAKKRAKVDATLAATRSSGIFTQDLDDSAAIDDSNGAGSKKAAQDVAPRKLAGKPVEQSGVPEAQKVDPPTQNQSAEGKSVVSSDRIGTVKVDICPTEVLLRSFRAKWVDDASFAVMKGTWKTRMEKYDAKQDTARECWTVTPVAFEKLSRELEELGYVLEIKTESPQSEPATKPAAKAAPQKAQKPEKATGNPASAVPTGRGIITKLEIRKGPKSQFAYIEQSGSVLRMFPNHRLQVGGGLDMATFDLLERAAREKEECEFVVVKGNKGGFWNADKVIRIGNLSWLSDGTPAKDRRAEPGKLF